MGGCFLGCFKSSSTDTKSQQKRKIKRNGSHEHLKSRFSPEQDIKASAIPISEDEHEPLKSRFSAEQEIKEIKEKHESLISIKEVKHEPLKSKFSPEQEIKAKHESVISIEEDKQEEKSSLTIRKNVTFDANVKTYEPVSICESTESLAENIQIDEKQEEKNLEKPSLPPYPSNHRYNNCQESDDEVDELESQDSYMDDEDGEYDEEDDFENYDENSDEIMVQELSSLNMSEKKTVNPMLNTVDSLAQWKALKTKTTTKTENKDREIAVDASLSNWLVSSDTTLKKKATFEPISQKKTGEDRPVLGALAMEEMLESKGNYWSSSGMRVKDIGAAFSYKGLPNAERGGEVLVK